MSTATDVVEGLVRVLPTLIQWAARRLKNGVKPETLTEFLNAMNADVAAMIEEVDADLDAKFPPENVDSDR